MHLWDLNIPLFIKIIIIKNFKTIILKNMMILFKFFKKIKIDFKNLLYILFQA